MRSNFYRLNDGRTDIQLTTYGVRHFEPILSTTMGAVNISRSEAAWFFYRARHAGATIKVERADSRTA